MPPCGLQPGQYRARAVGSWGVAAPATLAEARFQVRAGETTRLELQLAAAALVDCVVVRPESTPALGFAITWHDARDDLLWSSPLEAFRARSGIERTKKHELLPGSYRVTVVDELGRRGTAACVVESATAAPAPVVLRLR